MGGPIDFEAIRNVDGAVQNTNYVDRNVNVSSSSLYTDVVDPGVWPQSILYIEWYVTCNDNVDNGFTFRLQSDSTSDEILAQSSGQGSGTEMTERVKGSMTVSGHQLGDAADAPIGLQLALFNRGSSAKDFNFTINVWFLREGKQYASGAGNLSGHEQSAESFDP